MPIADVAIGQAFGDFDLVEVFDIVVIIEDKADYEGHRPSGRVAWRRMSLDVRQLF